MNTSGLTVASVVPTPISNVLGKVPRYSAFLTPQELDESTRQLAAEYPDLVHVEEVGRTTEGKTILALVIGEGNRTALFIGAPHPNEPVGTLTTDYLAREWAENLELRKALGFRLVIIKAIDRDGLLLNSGWLKQPLTPMNYALNYYRPPAALQPEWSFPINHNGYRFDQPIPETRALMGLIERYRPVFLYSLHNADVGELYYYLTRPLPSLHTLLKAYPRSVGLPLKNSQRTEEMWGGKRFDEAIYEALTTRRHVDYCVDKGIDPTSMVTDGAASWEYAQEFARECLGLVAEVPLFADPRGQDTTEIAMTWEELQEKETTQWDLFEELYRSTVMAVRARHEEHPGRFRDSAEWLMALFDRRKLLERTRERNWKGKVTVGETFQIEVGYQYYLLRCLGSLCRYVREQVTGPSLQEALLENVMHRMRTMNEHLEKELAGKQVSLRTAVQVQLAAGLHTMMALRG